MEASSMLPQNKFFIAFLVIFIFSGVIFVAVLDVQITVTLNTVQTNRVLEHDYDTTFFVESSNATHLSHRQACAVEAAAVAHYPNLVIVYMTGANPDDIKLFNSWIEDFKNVRIIRLDLDDLFKGSPIQKIWKSKYFQAGEYRITHIADLSRIVLLKKLGGLFLDLDLILTKSVLHLGEFMLQNYANGILRFHKDSPVLNVIHSNLEKAEYNRKSWTGLGSAIIKRSIIDFCGMEDNSKDFSIPEKNCNITFVPTEKFLPIPWYDWPKLFYKNMNEKGFWSKLMKEAYAMHTANHMTGKLVAYKNRSILITEISRKLCPRVFKTYPDTF